MTLTRSCGIRGCDRQVKVEVLIGASLMPDHLVLCGDHESAIFIDVNRRLFGETTARESAVVYNAWRRGRKGVMMPHRPQTIGG